MVSVVVPVYNNEPSLKELYRRLKRVLDGMDESYEIVFVDDASRDKSLGALEALVFSDLGIKIIKLGTNSGQSSAVLAGIQKAEGDTVVTIDADLQYDPQDILKLLKKIDEGYDVVFGWRRKRRDSLLLRRLPSFFANIFARIKLKSRIRDIGCSFIAAKRTTVLKVIEKGNKAFFYKPLLIKLADSFAEVEVNHFPRNNGRSQYGTIGLIKIALEFIRYS